MFIAFTLSCKKDGHVASNTPVGEQVDTVTTQVQELEDPTVLKVVEGDDLAAILADIPEGIKSLKLSEGTFKGPFTMVEGIDVKGSGSKTVLTVDEGRVLEQKSDFDIVTTWSDLSITGGTMSSVNGAGVNEYDIVCRKIAFNDRIKASSDVLFFVFHYDTDAEIHILCPLRCYCIISLQIV